MTASRAPADQDTLPPMASGKTRKNASGTQWGDEEYKEAGYGRLSLRLPESDLKKLEALAKKAGVTRSALLTEWIQQAWSERKS